MTITYKIVMYSPKSKYVHITEASGPGKPCAPKAAEEMFRILQGRWKLAILFHLFGDVDKKCRAMRFSELGRAIPAISQKMLIQRLRELERDGIVLRTIYPQIPPRVEYQLTNVGIAFRRALRALLAWAELQTPPQQVVRPGAHSGSSRCGNWASGSANCLLFAGAMSI
jgi:DNA-binding HxlR family transcriptional regulator